MLNKEQQTAVTTDHSAALVLSGAGTGKTTVLVSRIIYLMNTGVSIDNILAVTFNRKAANEIRYRLIKKLGYNIKTSYIDTFHGVCLRILKSHYKNKTFVILDGLPKYILLKGIIDDLNTKLDYDSVAKYIATQKNAGLRPDPLDLDKFNLVHKEYNIRCAEKNLLDFEEMIFSAYETLVQNSELLLQYQQQFSHCLVDEAQDTNHIQYEFLKLLTHTKQNLFLVGDDDQSIYGFRGAMPGNLTKFILNYPNHALIRLTMNYRSTLTIVRAANTVIANNTDRIGKVLKTDNVTGDKIKLYAAISPTDEGSFIVNEVLKLQAADIPLSSLAVLFRTNRQCHAITEQLMYNGIPFVSKGDSFFRHKAVEAVLSYIKVMVGQYEKLPMKVAINTPKRGIGDVTFDKIVTYGESHDISIWGACISIYRMEHLTKKVNSSLAEFVALVEQLKTNVLVMELRDGVEYIINTLKDLGWVVDEEGDETLNTLINLCENTNLESEGEGVTKYEQLLNYIALSEGDDSKSGVHLLTVHSSKGLEYHTVFLAGLEDGLFPHSNSPIEEERRLMYVAVTRAKTNLYLSYSKQKIMYKKMHYQDPSRFIDEISSSLIQKV